MESEKVILIVDDEKIGRDTLEALLYAQGYHLIFAGDGAEALSIVAEFEPDVILLDVMMPALDGFEVCRRLKANPRWRYIPVILVTALDSQEDLLMGIEAGADDFLSKPVNGLKLRARIRSMLRLKQQFDELKATLLLREDLTNMIVHDMRTPLVAILGYSELLLRRNLVMPKGVPDMQRIQAQARQLHSFTNDILMLAKMKQHQLILNTSPVDVAQLILQAQESHEILAQSKNVLVVSHFPGESRHVLLDANLFQRVLDNLISNALKFSPAEGKVTIQLEYLTEQPEAQQPPPSFLIKVLDEGPGIPRALRKGVFNKFETGPLNEGDMAQVGLGLSFCKMVVEAHGGTISIGDNEPHGAVFTVRI
jgi:signal transduction histidine kinase